jgi:hypothetical protein
MKLSTQDCRSDSNRFPREADRDSAMAIEGHRSTERKSPELMSTVEMDKELVNIKREMEELEMKMRQKKKSKLRWVNEWPMKTPKVKWLVREMMARRQRRLLRKWLRYDENLKATKEEEMVHICELELGEILGEENELGSSDDLIDCQERSGEFPYFHMGKETEMRSTNDLKDFQEGREEEILDCHEGNELRSVEDLMDCEEDSQRISHCQLGNEHRSLRDLEDC